MGMARQGKGEELISSPWGLGFGVVGVAHVSVHQEAEPRLAPRLCGRLERRDAAGVGHLVKVLATRILWQGVQETAVRYGAVSWKG